jgi:uncharacterized protein (TIGR02147 family)
METKEINNTDKLERPDLFEYTDYRAYLKDCFEVSRKRNPALSETAFIQRAGFGKNARGYFSLLMSGKRNLSPATIFGFSKALNHTRLEAEFFENLVMYNQALNEVQKNIYFERLSKSSKAKKTQAFKLLKSQYNYLSNWYAVVLREMISLDDFKEDVSYIQNKLGGKISAKQITEAIDDLMSLGLITRDVDGRLIQMSRVVNFVDSSMNYTVVKNIQKSLLKEATDAIDKFPYQQRSISNSVIACDSDDLESIREEIKQFRQNLINKYCTGNKKTDCVYNLGVQLFPMTTK